MTNARKLLGGWGEDLAANYLLHHGYTLLDRNARTPYGELDLVVRPPDVEGGNVTVFVEVKTRSSTRYGLPEESVTPRKQAHLVAAAQAYLLAHPELDGDWRIDVIAIQRYRSKRTPSITHFENAIRGD